MLRTYQPADLITLANGAAGTSSVFAAMSYLTTAEHWRIYLALALIPLALVLDILDGKVARHHQEQSLFGQELDSLADIVSFGVAPAALAYALGMRGAVDMLLLIFFVSCGISRLAIAGPTTWIDTTPANRNSSSLTTTRCPRHRRSSSRRQLARHDVRGLGAT